MKSVLRVLMLLALLAALALGAGYVWLRLSLPQLDATITLSGLKAPVEIVRDRHGVLIFTRQRRRRAVRARLSTPRTVCGRWK